MFVVLFGASVMSVTHTLLVIGNVDAIAELVTRPIPCALCVLACVVAVQTSMHKRKVENKRRNRLAQQQPNNGRPWRTAIFTCVFVAWTIGDALVGTSTTIAGAAYLLGFCITCVALHQTHTYGGVLLVAYICTLCILETVAIATVIIHGNYRVALFALYIAGACVTALRSVELATVAQDLCGLIVATFFHVYAVSTGVMLCDTHGEEPICSMVIHDIAAIFISFGVCLAAIHRTPLYHKQQQQHQHVHFAYNNNNNNSSGVHKISQSLV